MIDSIAFRVIGERTNNPAHLLVVDDEGQCYDYDLIAEEIIPIEVDGAWSLDIVEESNLIIEAPIQRLAS